MEATTQSGVAAVMSFFIPGLGQIFRGQIMEAVFWFIFCVVGYVVFFPIGIVVHVACIAKAYQPRKVVKSS